MDDGPGRERASERDPFAGVFGEQERMLRAEIGANGITYRVGDQVRLRPKGTADAFDLLLNGRTATIESIEQDYEDRVYLAVTVDDDPGKDYGQERRPAHRFFYTPDDVEPLGRDGDR